MDRRRFIKQIVGGGLVLVGGTTTVQKWLQWQQEAPLEFVPLMHLDADRQLLIAALVPVFCQGMPVIPPLDQINRNIDSAISRLPRRSQQELAQLFDLLTSVWGRLLLAGQWYPWAQAQARSLDEFLTSWRENSIQLLQIGYKGLHQLIMGAVYAEPETWQGIGYPGPPVIPDPYPVTTGESV